MLTRACPRVRLLVHAARRADTPAQHMVSVGVFGLLGKTTVAWLVRGILEELGQTVGLMSTIEDAIAEDRCGLAVRVEQVLLGSCVTL
jgi:UDP-N-acetylmuramyl tripeptide synthase